MKVTLLNPFEDPFNNAIATARTCYSGKGIITPQEASEKEELRNQIAASTFFAGHHTVYQHLHLQFAIKGISRLAIWSFLHSHSNYNSEQQSYRYVQAKRENMYCPEFKQQASVDLYWKQVDKMFKGYKTLNTKLFPIVEDYYFQRFPARRKHSDKYKKDIEKKCQEVGRYLLPLGQTTDLYHTVNLITFIRYCQTVSTNQCYKELASLLGEMKMRVIEQEPALQDFFKQKHLLDLDCQFDLLDQQEPVKLISYNNLDMLTESNVNMSSFGTTVNCHNHLNQNKHLDHIHFTFDKNVSHVCDSQAQRHRTTARLVAPLRNSLQLDVPYVIPNLLKDLDLMTDYQLMLEEVFDTIRKIISLGEDVNDCLYLAPNAIRVRVRETTNLANLIHKHKMRLCLNAQEEFWDSCMKEKQQIQQISSIASDLLQPPCVFRDRAKKTPKCPEGNRYCGVPIWSKNSDEWLRAF